MKKIFSFFIALFCSLSVYAATEFAQLESALKKGDFATVQKLVPAKFNILKTTIDGKNLKEYAVDLRKLHDDTNVYDQIAYYLGAENKNVSTPLVVFVKTHVKKLGIACLVALGLYVTKKEHDKRKSKQPDPVPTPGSNQNTTINHLRKPGEDGFKYHLRIYNAVNKNPTAYAQIIFKANKNEALPGRENGSITGSDLDYAPNTACLKALEMAQQEDIKHHIITECKEPQSKIKSKLFDTELQKPMTSLQSDGSLNNWSKHGLPQAMAHHMHLLTQEGQNKILEPLYFYEQKQAFYQFTNFAPYPITINGKTWPTSEHYFQGQKFADQPTIMEKVRQAKTCRDAFNIGKQNQMTQTIAITWNNNGSRTAMKQALHAKFTQHSELHDLLLATGDMILVENAGANDAKWGAGGNGQGQNLLGLALMELRHQLRTK